MHSVLFLVLDFLFVAALYVLLGAQFLAVIQVLVYAGGIVVLVSVRRHAGEPEAAAGGASGSASARRKLGFGLSAAVLRGARRDRGLRLRAPRRRRVAAAAPMPVTGNTEQVGWLLYTSYLIPFEIASMLLLVAMIGAIVLAKASCEIG